MMYGRKTKITAVVSGVAGLSLVAALLLVANIGPQAAQAYERAKVPDHYGAYLLQVDTVYTAIQERSWQYDLYKTQQQNLDAFKAWFCVDDAGQPLTKCSLPKDVTAFMLFVKDNKNRIYFDKVVNSQWGNALNHEIRGWLLKAYSDSGHGNNGKDLNQQQMAKALQQGFKKYKG